MKIRDLIIAISLFFVANPATILPSVPENVIIIRSEGGSKIVNGNMESSRNQAMNNAIYKAIKSLSYEIASLSQYESDQIMSKLEPNTKDYITGYEINEDKVLNGVIRIILDVQILPEKLVDIILSDIGIPSFRHKPRIMIALSDEQKPLIAALEKGFTRLGFRVIAINNNDNELKSNIEIGDTDRIIKAVAKLGCEVVITGECVYTKIENNRLGKMVSWQNEASLKAIRCQDKQILSAGNYKGTELSLNEQTGKRKTGEKIAQELIADFPQKIVKIWLTDMVLGKIKQTPFPSNVTPPEIIIDSPYDQLVTEDITVRFVGSAKFDEDLGEVKFYINGSSLALDGYSHLSSNNNIILFNRQIPLRIGDNTLSISAVGKNCEKTEKSIKVVCDPSRKVDNSLVNIKIEFPTPNQKVSEESILVTGEIISKIPIKDQIDITVNGKEPVPFRGMKIKRNPEKENEQSIPINKQVFLTQGLNDIAIMVTSEDGQKFKKNVPVFYIPFSQSIAEQRKFAVIIGINKYADSDIDSLKVASVDAMSIYKILTDQKGGNFPKENVRILIDENATRESIMQSLGEWLPSQVKSGDMVFIFYSGHGGVEPDLTGEEPDGISKYIIPHDANVENLFSTAIQNSSISKMLQRISSNKMIFFIDCCYSGGVTTGDEVIKSITPPSIKVGNDVYNDFSGSGRVVISASLPDQVSFEVPELNHGIFTYNLIEGISGKADFDQDGSLTLIAEIYPFLSNEVNKMANKMGFRQNPTLKCQVVGDIVISRVIMKMD
jgi:hypothetical protein